VPEVIRFARTIEAWQAPIIAALQTGLTNARTEGCSRNVKHVGRIAFGFRNPDNQRRRVRWACTRRSRRAAPSRHNATANCEEPDIARFMELLYNRCRLHPSLGYRAPHEVRTEYMNSQLAVYLRDIRSHRRARHTNWGLPETPQSTGIDNCSTRTRRTEFALVSVHCKVVLRDVRNTSKSFSSIPKIAFYSALVSCP
jgi:hypothetical protein